ncbi:MAG: hypothetical protein ACE5IH_06650 [Thermodesulfobacteriota bacterium]
MDKKNITTYSLKDRKSKVSIEDFSRPFNKGEGFKEFLATLPDILGSKNLKEIVSAIALAHRSKRMILFGMGAHVMKVGLSPIIIDLMERGIIGGIALNGAGIVHDFEVAYAGCTSEDVDEAIDDGRFGMAEETGQMINEAIVEGVKKGWGIGRSIGEKMLEVGLPHNRFSIIAAGVRIGIPITVHVAIGTDIFHYHPAVDGGALGEGGLTDFRIFSKMVASLDGGVYMNIGSAVVLPEVFLKALTLARNMGNRVDQLTTVNMDFIQHYRPLTNVVRRPVRKGGKGYSLTGHHEIMIPLLSAALIEELG